MIERELADKIRTSSRQFPVVAIVGPRQSGKTTLVQSLFRRKPYVSLEDLDTRTFAQEDPRGFLSQFRSGAVIDEVQRVPELLSYLQGIVDLRKKHGLFILTGSQQLLLMKNLSQTLAGRVRLLTLLPLSLRELRQAHIVPRTMEQWVVRGAYPRLYDKRVPPGEWHHGYIQTYLERDVRLLQNIQNLSAFQRFITLCAAWTGQLLNFSALANDCGITHNTARAWMSLLEASFIIHLLRPYHRNIRKRLVKTPKLYFHDTGLACALLGITDAKQLAAHPLRGPLFETAVLSEFLKHRHNRGLAPQLSFFRDKTGHEVDILLDAGGALQPVEVKSGKTVSGDFFMGMTYWQTIAPHTREKPLLIYGGDSPQKRSAVTVLGWRDLADLSSYLD